MLGVGDKSPPPLKSDVLPWALNKLTARQYDQLHLSNVLLHVALSLFVVLLGTGGLALLEDLSLIHI